MGWTNRLAEFVRAQVVERVQRVTARAMTVVRNVISAARELISGGRQQGYITEQVERMFQRSLLETEADATYEMAEIATETVTAIQENLTLPQEILAASELLRFGFDVGWTASLVGLWADRGPFNRTFASASSFLAAVQNGLPEEYIEAVYLEDELFYVRITE